MIWLAWRQVRTQTLIVFGALLALMVVLRVTGAQLRHQFAVFNACVRSNCTDFSYTLHAGEEIGGHYVGQAVVYALPILTGFDAALINIHPQHITALTQICCQFIDSDPVTAAVTHKEMGACV